MSNKDYFKKLSLLLAIVLVAAFIPLLGLWVYSKTIPKVYKDSYYGALPVKYDRLKEIKEPKIVVIGGSSVAFGIDAELVEKETGMPCANFGLYAAFGFKPMLDLADGYIKKGDIVVLAPELSDQMYSDYIGYSYLLQAMEGRTDMALSLGSEYWAGLVKYLPDHAKAAKKIKNDGGLKLSGVYTSSSFNQKGNMIYERPASTMIDGYATDNLPEISQSLVSQSFVQMVNEFTKKASKKGANVYFSFPPVNDLSVQGISDKDKKDMVDKLANSLDCPILSSLDDHIFDANYFYDSNFHTNEAGTIYNTVLLINDLNRELGKMKELAVTVPKAPANPNMGQMIASGDDGTFTYRITTTGVAITGLTEAGLKLDKLEIPSELEGYIVNSIAGQAFLEANAREVVLPETIKSLSAGLFAKSKVESVVINSTSMPEVGNSLLEEAKEGIKLYVPADMLGGYMTDYFWGSYSDYLLEIKS